VSGIEVTRAISLGQFPHGFLGRRGGISVGECAGLNVGFGSNDDAEAIAGNRRLAISALLPDAELATVHQVHSAEVVVADAPWPQDARPRADAMVTDATIEAMERLGARRDHIHAAVGPCIAQPSYEVDDGFRARFLEDEADNSRFFVPGPASKPHFDLEAYVVHRLIAAGIDEVEALNLDTYADPDRFYSYRLASHRGEADYGRQLSAIAIPG
jgi:copper oxidase (laccase) domain-containing protein